MVFDTLGTKAIVITDNGYWTIFELSVRTGRTTQSSSGHIEMSVSRNKDFKSTWWKMEWIDHTEEILVAENHGLHLLDVMVTSSSFLECNCSPADHDY